LTAVALELNSYYECLYAFMDPRAIIKITTIDAVVATALARRIRIDSDFASYYVLATIDDQ